MPANGRKNRGKRIRNQIKKQGPKALKEYLDKKNGRK